MNICGIDINEYLESVGISNKKEEQINLFESAKSNNQDGTYINAWAIFKLYSVLSKKMEEDKSIELFYKIEMPLVEVLAEMEYEGIYIDKNELVKFGNELKERIDILQNN